MEDRYWKKKKHNCKCILYSNKRNKYKILNTKKIKKK